MGISTHMLYQSDVLNASCIYIMSCCSVAPCSSTQVTTYILQEPAVCNRFVWNAGSYPPHCMESHLKWQLLVSGQERKVVFFLLGDNPASDFFVPTFQNTLFQLHRSFKNKTNKWDEIARVFIQLKVWLNRSFSQLQVRGMGRGHVRVEDQAVEGNSPKWRPVVRQGCEGETVPCRSEGTPFAHAWRK